jgi:hypothetical protein
MSGKEIIRGDKNSAKHLTRIKITHELVLLLQSNAVGRCQDIGRSN